ncbi:FHA domain-containing protein [Aliiglaciecola litoralis]|uniref:FHA domain-containing protein n=1 Tax=Aliiglaciecola litoralis TaxID=582857 RepID=A0ABP3WLE9_9ALTE
MAIVVEMLSKDGKVLQHYFIPKEQVSIGRAYDNDIRIDDPYVSPHHANFSITEDNNDIAICDLESLNGVKINGKKSADCALSYDDVITLGRTRLRIFKPCQQVPPTIVLSELEENLSWLGYRRVCFILLSVFFGLVGIKYLNNNPGQFEASVLVEAFMRYAVVVSIWPFAFALLSKLAKKDSHIISQFSLLWLFLISIELLDYVQAFLLFNLDAISAVNGVMLLNKSLLFFALFWFTLFLAFHQSRRARNSIAATGTVLVSLYVLFPILFGANDFSPNPKYTSTMMAPAFRVVPTVEAHTFVQDSTDKMVEKLSKARLKSDP